MPRRSPARYLAPLAIVAFLVALAVIVSSSGESAPGGSAPGESDSVPAAATPEGRSGEEPAERSEEDRPRTGPKTYRVRPGDTPSTIAEKTGVPLEELEALNPDIDPQALAPGQRLRLRR